MIIKFVSPKNFTIAATKNLRFEGTKVKSLVIPTSQINIQLICSGKSHWFGFIQGQPIRYEFRILANSILSFLFLSYLILHTSLAVLITIIE